MGRKWIVMLTGTLLVSSFAIGVAGIVGNLDNRVKSVGATEITTTITSDMLAATALETYTWTFKDNQTKAGEGKFRIELDDDKYIDGAVLYQDCAHQTLSSNLGGTFSLDNSEQSSANNLNFHFFFSVFGIKKIQTTFQCSITGSGTQSCIFRTKYLPENSITDFFKDRSYSTCVSNDSDKVYSAYYDFSLSGSETTHNPPSCDYDTKANLFAIQFHSEGVPSGAKASFALTQLKLTYTC